MERQSHPIWNTQGHLRIVFPLSLLTSSLKSFPSSVWFCFSDSGSGLGLGFGDGRELENPSTPAADSSAADYFLRLSDLRF